MEKVSLHSDDADYGSIKPRPRTPPPPSLFSPPSYSNDGTAATANDIDIAAVARRKIYERSNSTGHEALKVRHARRASLTREPSRRFSILMSTEEFNRAQDVFPDAYADTDTAQHDHDGGVYQKHYYYGPYAHLRKRLDHDYHVHYKKERQWLQDSIIEDLLFVDEQEQHQQQGMTPREPWLLYTVGVMGAGKQHTLSKLIRHGRLPLLSYVLVDADAIRRRLPEFASYLQKARNGDSVNELTRKEAGYICELVVRAALQAGRNVVLDTSLYSIDWYVDFTLHIKEEYSSLKVGVLYITAPRQVILDRVEKHAQITERTIPEETIDRALELLPQSIERIAPLVDYYCTIRNDNDELTMVTDGQDWESFRTTFEQDCAWPTPKRPSVLHQEAVQQKQQRQHAEEKKEGVERFIPMKPHPKLRRTFSVLRSTEDNHRAETLEFFGPYSHIRETLDYNFHTPYTRERQILQDAIITDMLSTAVIKDTNGDLCTTPTEPWIVFTAGAMGAGKTHTMNMLVEKGHFPLLAFVAVDPDEIRRHLPEFHLYVEQSPELAGELTRKEAGYIAEILTLAGLQAGKNVLVDGSLRDWEWHKEYFVRLRHDFPNLRIAIIHVTAPRDAVFQRAAERALITGRVVPMQTLVDALEQVPKSCEILGPLADYYCVLNNAPDALDIELLTEGETWENFTRQWIQTCAWVPPHRSKSSIDLTKKMQEAELKISMRSSASLPILSQQNDD